MRQVLIKVMTGDMARKIISWILVASVFGMVPPIVIHAMVSRIEPSSSRSTVHYGLPEGAVVLESLGPNWYKFELPGSGKFLCFCGNNGVKTLVKIED